MTLPSPVRAVWKSAELLIAFHKNKKREKRDDPYLWRPKEAFARLLAKPEDQEAFVVLKGADGVEDVQIKLHPDKVVIRREQPLGWSGIIIDEHTVRVNVDNVWVRIVMSDNHLGRCRQPPWPVGLDGRRACPSGGQPHRPD